MKPVRVTIGIPFFNAERTLPDTLRSVFAQKFQDWELILVDDGSADRSWSIATSVCDPRVTVYRDGKHRTLSPRLNEIASRARGEYLARMDSDDLMHPERLETQVDYLDRHPEIDVVGTALYSLDKHDRPWGILTIDRRSQTPAGILKRTPLNHATVMGRTSWFRLNLYDEEYLRAEDRELWCRTFATSTFGYLPIPLYFYREGRFSLSNYLTSCRTDRKILRTYGPRVMASWRLWSLVFRSYLKGFAYRLACALGLEGRLLSLRSIPLDEAGIKEASEILKTILATHVPGLDPPEAVTQDRVRCI
jgi:glycosyltransferase involved in cell wall biosynthesis